MAVVEKTVEASGLSANCCVYHNDDVKDRSSSGHPLCSSPERVDQPVARASFSRRLLSRQGPFELRFPHSLVPVPPSFLVLASS